MNKFWELLKESIIVQAFITTLCLTATVILALTGRPIPEILETMNYLVVGFYFGSKSIASSRAATTDAIHAFIDPQALPVLELLQRRVMGIELEPEAEPEPEAKDCE